MASRYYVGPAAGAWNDNANWSSASGGAGGSSFPAAGDDAFLDAGSAGNGPTLTANAACATLDCTGFTGTLDMGGFSLTLDGNLFKLVAGMTFTSGAANPEVDLTSTAGTCLVTTAGHALGSLRCGNAGAGGTYQLQDALAVTRDLNLVNGTFDANNQNVTVGRDLIVAATMAAASITMGSGTWDITRHVTISSANNVFVVGTSTLIMSGTGQWTQPAGSTQNLYDFTCGQPGQATTIEEGNVASSLRVNNRWTMGTGTTTLVRSRTFVWDSADVDGFSPDPASTLNGTFRISAATTNLTYHLPECTVTGGFQFYGGTFGGPSSLTMTGDVVMTGLLQVYCNTSSFILFDTGGFDLTVNAMQNGQVGVYSSATIIRTGSIMNVATNWDYLHTNFINNHPYLTLEAGAQVTVGGNLAFSGGTATPALNMGAGCLLSIGGDLSIAVAGQFWSGVVDPTAVIRFTDAGAFAFPSHPIGFQWPIFQVAGGGTASLHDGFVCWNLEVLNGTLTALGNLTILNAYNGSLTSSLTLGGDTYVGSSFTSLGTVVTAGTDIITTGVVVSLSGVNPDDLTLGAETARLQLLTGMTIGALTLAPRVTPAVVQMLAGGTYSIGSLDSQVSWPDAPVQFVSSVAGTAYAMPVTAVVSLANIWPRDWNASGGAALAGGLSNKNLGGNTGWTLNTPGLVRVVSEDAGASLLAAWGYGDVQYCWLVADSEAALTTLAANFATGADNWHRRTVIPLAFLDNLSIGGTWYVALGLRNERDERLAPDVGAGDFVSLIAGSDSGGGVRGIVNNFQFAHMG